MLKMLKINKSGSVRTTVIILFILGLYVLFETLQKLSSSVSCQNEQLYKAELHPLYMTVVDVCTPWIIPPPANWALLT